MKKIISLVAIAFSFNVFATSLVNPEVEANLFLCEAGNTSITYSTTSFIGKPELSVVFEGVQAKLDGDVQTEKTSLGRLVSGLDTHLVPIDGPSIRYSIFIPNVMLENNATPVEFETVALRKAIANPFFGPRGGRAFTNIEAVNVKCEAQFVWF